jgi:hypothetical protein
MPRKCVDVLDKDGCSRLDRGPADAATDGDADTGGFPLERPQDEFVLGFQRSPPSSDRASSRTSMPRCWQHWRPHRFRRAEGPSVAGSVPGRIRPCRPDQSSPFETCPSLLVFVSKWLSYSEAGKSCQSGLHAEIIGDYSCRDLVGLRSNHIYPSGNFSIMGLQSRSANNRRTFADSGRQAKPSPFGNAGHVYRLTRQRRPNSSQRQPTTGSCFL